MDLANAEWICAQVGAREYYAVPRAVHAAGHLRLLVTELWPSLPTALLPSKRLHERGHADLPADRVWAPNVASLGFEALIRLRGINGWPAMIQRNHWFQQQAIGHLQKMAATLRGRRVCLFSYSYTAKRLFQFARDEGWTTVLGQIDPGPVEERLVSRLHQAHPGLASAWVPAPAEYWRDWRDECETADSIVVNSEWSRSALVEEGVPASRLVVVPLAYQSTATERRAREYPAAFTRERPLRVLFLGQVSLRKGMAEIIDAMTLLKNEPVSFTIVGPVQITIPDAIRDMPNVTWAGPVSRGEASRYFEQADVFLFPTHSDGFGLTQLEALDHALPIVASGFCGEVVRPGVNGVRLATVSAASIADALRGIAADPARLTAMSAACLHSESFGLDRVWAGMTRRQ